MYVGCRAAVPGLGYEYVPSSPQAPYIRAHTHVSDVWGHRPATVRRAGRKRCARFESSEALAEQLAVARSAVELHGTWMLRQGVACIGAPQSTY